MAIYWHKIGEGKTPLVLIHGWGMNATVWESITELLSPHFTLYLVDLPGYGTNREYSSGTLEHMSELLLPSLPEHAFIAGWSLGGLLANHLALSAGNSIKGLITIASSPCFVEKQDWKGIQAPVLQNFITQVGVNPEKTLKRFLSLQTLGTHSARQDTTRLQVVVSNQDIPDIAVLRSGLHLLQTSDLRPLLNKITVPVLNIYGELDNLSPLNEDNFYPYSEKQVISGAGHVPFLSHPDLFCQMMIKFAESK